MTWTLTADFNQMDGTNSPLTTEVTITANVQVKTATTLFDPMTIKAGTNTATASLVDGVLMVKLPSTGGDVQPSAFGYYVSRPNKKAGMTCNWHVPAQVSGTHDLTEFTDTTSLPVPPSVEARVAALEAGGGSGYDDSELVAAIQALSDRLDAVEAGGGGGGATPPTHITATPPTITDAAGTSSDILHLANQTGVIWRVNLDDVTPGDKDAHLLAGYPDFTVTAVADDGYALDGQTTFSFSFDTASGGPVTTTIWRDQFTTAQDPIVLPRTPDTTGTKQWQGDTTNVWIAGGQLRAHGPNGNVVTVGFDSWIDTGSTHHVVAFGYDLSHVPHNGNAEYNSIVAAFAGISNRAHRISLVASSTGAVRLTGSGPTGVLAFTPQNSVDLDALAASGTFKVETTGLTITVTVGGTVVATAPQQPDMSGDVGTGVGISLSPYIPGTDEALYLAVSDVTAQTVA